MSEFERITEGALKLDPNSRAKLAQRLLRSLDELSPEEIEKLWVDEAERRSIGLKAGEANAVPAEEVFKKARKQISG